MRVHEKEGFALLIALNTPPDVTGLLDPDVGAVSNVSLSCLPSRDFSQVDTRDAVIDGKRFIGPGEKPPGPIQVLGRPQLMLPVPLKAVAPAVPEKVIASLLAMAVRIAWVLALALSSSFLSRRAWISLASSLLLMSQNCCAR